MSKYLCLLFFTLLVHTNAFASDEFTASEKQFIETQGELKVAVLAETVNEEETVDRNDEFFDITLDYMYGIANEIGVPLSVTSYQSVAEVYEAVETHQVDLAAGFADTERRKQRFEFSHPLFQSNQAIGYKKLSDQSKAPAELTWVCVQGSQYCDVLAEQGAHDVYEAMNFFSAITAMNEGHADAILDSYVSLIEYLNDTNSCIAKVEIPVWAKPLNIGVFSSGSNPWLKIIDRVLLRKSLGSNTYPINSDSPYHKTDMVNVLFARQYDQGKAIRFTLETGIYPLFFFTEEGQPSGFIQDVIELLESRTNLNFEYVPLEEGVSAEQMVEQGKADVVPIIVNETKDVNILRLTKPYTRLKYVSMEMKHRPAAGDDKVGVLLSYDHERRYMRSLNESDFGDHPHFYTEFPEIVNALESGKITRAFVSENLVDLILTQQIGEQFVINTNVYRTINISMGVSATNPMLVKLLNSAFETLDGFELRKIKRNYEMFNVTYGYEKSRVIKLFGVAAIVFMLFLVAAYIWSQRLKLQLTRNERRVLHTHQELELLQGVINGLPMQVFIHDYQNRLLLTNCTEFREGDCSRCQMKNNKTQITLIENQAEIEQVLVFDKVIERTVDIKDCKLEINTIKYHRKRIVSRAGKKPLVLTTITDVTEQKEQEKNLIKANKLAKGAVLARERFLASMSHELRTPIAGMSGLIEMLASKLNDEESKVLLDNISASTRNLNMLVNDILDFSKIEARKLELDKSPVNLIKVVGEVVRMHQLIAQDKGLDFKLDIEPSTVREVNIDSLRFSQIMNNLLSNAIKFTEQGSISTEISVNENQLHICVADTGQGMTEEQKNKAFDPFVQADTSTARKYGGTGLGLTIVKNLVTIMGGKLSIESELHQGTRLSFYIPLEVVSRFDSKLDIGWVEYQGTDEVIRNWIDIWVGNNTHLPKTVTVYDAENAYKAARSIQKAIVFSSKVVDFKHAHGHVTELPQSPFYPDLLFDSITAAHHEEPVPAQNELPKFKGRVLVAEDNEINQFLMRKQLKELGIDAHIVSDGEAAFQLLERHAERFDLLITDCHMPNMDGYALSANVREKLRAFDNKPIIGCTAADTRAEPAELQNTSFDCMLYKPYTLTKLAAKLSRFLPINSSKGGNKRAKLQARFWLEQFAGEEREQMASHFFNSMEEDLAKLSALYGDDFCNKVEIARLAHRIKGGASAVGLADLSEKAQWLEQGSKNKDVDLKPIIKTLMMSLSSEIKQTQEWLEEHA